MYIISSIADQNHALHHRILILANTVVYATIRYLLYGNHEYSFKKFIP